jgi:ankyrin repeat protein
MKRPIWTSTLGAALCLLLLSCPRPKSDEPLLDATIRGDVTEVERLIYGGLHPDHRYNNRATALAYAASHGELATALALIERGADVNAKHDGVPVLVVAAAGGSPQIVRALLEKGADVNAKTTKGFTALMAAAANGGDIDIVRQLLAKGADVHARTVDGRTALSFSKGYARHEVRKLLKAAGATE